LVGNNPKEPAPVLKSSKALAQYARGCDHAEKAAASRDPGEQRAEYQKAVAALNDAAAADTTGLAEIYTRRAAAQYHLGKYKEAVADAQAALKLDPSSATAYSHLGEALTRTKDFVAALEAHQKAVNLDPNYARAYNARGQTYAAMKQYDSALNEFSEALYRNPELKYAFTNRGFAYCAVKPPDPDLAIQDHRKAIKIDRKFARAHFGLGLAHLDKKDFKSAVEALSDAITYEPKNPQHWLVRGLARMGIGGKDEYEKARADFTEAINLDETLADAYEFRSQAYRLLGNDTEAERDLTRAKAWRAKSMP
jgi:tetratricopeptide (TPR) repeat protein